MATQIYAPSDAAGMAAVLQVATTDNLSVVVHGGGTTFVPPPSDVVLHTTKLTAPIDHVAGDLVATVPAGVPLDVVNDVLRREHQWLPLDPPRSHRATIGGIVATNDSGPRRHRFGSPRDLIIGIQIALVDGRTARAGGRVVKNVAGYDLSRLMCGSLGTLAVITSATFKLSPVAACSQTLVATVAGVKSLSDLALALAAAPITPSAIELQSPPHRLLVRFETTEAAAAAQTNFASGLCASHGAAVAVIAGGAETDAWRAHENRIFSAPGTVVKIAVLPTDVADILAAAQRLASRVECEVAGRASLGIVFLRLGGDASAHTDIVATLRRDAAARGGSAVVVSAPEAVMRSPEMVALGRWGALGDAGPVMRAVKARFDPHNILNAGLSPWD